MFGCNKSAVNTASLPHGKLTKRHMALSFHRTRHAIAAGLVRFHFLRGETNPADILSEHWDYATVKNRLRALLFWEGDTAEMEEFDAKKHGTKSQKANKE